MQILKQKVLRNAMSNEEEFCDQLYQSELPMKNFCFILTHLK